MARPEQIVRIEPENELKFKGPYNVPVTSYMTLFNPTEKRVVFKIKTTAPKKYCVRPNSGILEPNKLVEIAICLQPLLYDQSDKNKHKFMVQTVIAPDGEFCVDTLWKDISPDKLMDSKLKCVFDMNMLQDQQQRQNTTGSATAVAATGGGGGAAATLNANNELNQESDEKIKKSESKSSPKAQMDLGTSQNSSADSSELVKAAQDIKQLREDESNLRQENLQLKEEILRLKLNAGQPIREHSGASTNTSKYQPVAQPPRMSIMYLALAIAMAVCGIIVGKFVL